ncbi:hypothetical protein [Bacillus sp. FJAT-45037]|uniref:hypothetical protein n=1 Tax=Bacillus sp. FJAT-45037 TaxID=2011007 RepID=UPI000C24C275|nr:hypothetical protein [Bacillus sp. FJAT-45037]
MNQFSAQSTMILSDLKKSILIFWAILTAFVVFFFGLVVFIDIPTMYVMTAPPMYVFIAIFGYRLISSGDLAYVIHLGSTRGMFVLSTALLMLLLSFAFSMFHRIYLLIIAAIQPVITSNDISFFHWSDLVNVDNAFALNFLADGLIMCAIGMFLFFLSSLQFRFGQWATLSVVGGIVLYLFIPAVHTPIGDWLLNLPSNERFMTDILYLIPVTLLFVGLSYATLRRASI